MARAYSEIAFTNAVLEKQNEFGSAGGYAKFLAPGVERNDSLTEDENAFIAARDGFYQATVSETGWPYVQFRGGPRGFVKVLDEKTLAYADFRGNRQYLSVGNLSRNDRISLFFMDYPNRRRLKLLGRTRLIDIKDDPTLVARLTDPDYNARPERAVIISLAGFDWNCPAHIPQRFTVEELEPSIATLHGELTRLKADNAELERANAALKARLQSAP